ncbi:MAG: helix-turn-helix domain-containing protein [Bacteriovoracales bacterium]|nr:helix-turn-helix domain-containing protein [Bacteriovoracales bacterium]
MMKKTQFEEREKLITIAQTSRILNVKESWVRSAVFKKTIPFIKIGHHVRFDEGELMDWIGRNRKGLGKEIPS